LAASELTATAGVDVADFSIFDKNCAAICS
jgi:hypothetical protein